MSRALFGGQAPTLSKLPGEFTYMQGTIQDSSVTQIGTCNVQILSVPVSNSTDLVTMVVSDSNFTPGTSSQTAFVVFADPVPRPSVSASGSFTWLNSGDGTSYFGAATLSNEPGKLRLEFQAAYAQVASSQASFSLQYISVVVQ